MSSTIEINDLPVRAALTQLHDRVGNLSPVLRALGEDMAARMKQRFETTTGPDGSRWKANAQSTMEAFVYAKGGIGKTGKINKKGQAVAMSKKPLTGHTGDLKRGINYNVNGDGLLVFAQAPYAAMQQFGGTKSQFPNLWGDIPARPFFPITSSGELAPAERQDILETLQRFLTN